ncbi:hypothetical protein [Pigmentiphaga daeguensis]|uniref:Replicative helicase loader/inhibitor n=1 Tax=Pigmentiphaga daeguensis TaxID=414049 RepID=A0ABN1D5S0_9BURK
MSEDDFDALSDLLDDVHELRGIPLLSDRAKALFFRAIQQFPWPLVEKAIQAHIQDPAEGKFRSPIQPAHVIGQIEQAMQQGGRPGADEAWAIALRGRDERETVVWTEEIAGALSEVRPVLQAGDDTGARMAFRQAYDRLVADARRARRPMRWMPSLGTDASRREVAITHAVNAGLLPAPAAAALLPPPMPEEGPTAAGLAQLAEVKRLLSTIGSPRDRLIDARMTANAEERARLQAAKQRTAAAVRSRE